MKLIFYFRRRSYFFSLRLSTYFLLITIIVNYHFAYAQDTLVEYLPRIVSFPNYVTLRTGVGTSFNDFGIIDKPTGLKFSVTPNADTRATFSLLYRSLEVDFGFAPGLLNSEKGLVESKLLVFNIRTYLGQWMQSFDFYRIVGFEFKGTNFAIPEAFALVYADLNVLKIGGTTSYIFNENFSFRAITFQNEWQRKSSGSFIPRLTYYFTRLKNNSPERDYYYDITAGPSYFYNWVIAEDFIVSAGVKAGLGINVTHVKNSELSNNDTETGINYNVGSEFLWGITPCVSLPG